MTMLIQSSRLVVLALVLVLPAAPPAFAGIGADIVLFSTQSTIFEPCGLGAIDVSSFHRTTVVSTSGNVEDLTMKGQSRRCGWINSTLINECHGTYFQFPEAGDVMTCTTPKSTNNCYLKYCARTINQIAFPAPDTETVESACEEPDENDCDESI